MEADFALVDVEKAVIGDGDAMGVSRDVGQDLFGTGEGRFGVDPPFCLSGGSEVALKGAAVAMFPGKEETFDLIYLPRFSRLLAERFGAN